MKKVFKNKKLVKIGTFEVPKFWDCGWRRVACEKKSCALCGKILKDRQKHIGKGEDPDDLKSVFEDVGNSFKEALNMIKKDAERLGIEIINIDKIKEPPPPSKFSLYKKVAKWRDFVSRIIETADNGRSLWLQTEAAADLIWYKNTIAAKTYRQLSNRWHMKHGDEYGDFDYEYTHYALTECIGILENALKELSLLATDQKGELLLTLSRLNTIKKEILKI